MKGATFTLGLLLVALAAPVALGGPAEINGLAAQLKSINAEIRETEARMRSALQNLSGGAGEQSQQLRALKRERERVKQELQQATKAQQERDAMTTGMPIAKPRMDLGPAVTDDARPGAQRPRVEVAPSGAMVPAPSL